MNTLTINNTSLESLVGKYGLFWINYLEDTNYNLYIRLKNDINEPLYKIAKEINKRTYLLIEEIIKSKPIQDINSMSHEQKEVAQHTRYMQAEEIALHQIIYNK